jgi:hypothetical protein
MKAIPAFHAELSGDAVVAHVCPPELAREIAP